MPLKRVHNNRLEAEGDHTGPEFGLDSAAVHA